MVSKWQHLDADPGLSESSCGPPPLGPAQPGQAEGKMGPGHRHFWTVAQGILLRRGEEWGTRAASKSNWHFESWKS